MVRVKAKEDTWSAWYGDDRFTAADEYTFLLFDLLNTFRVSRSMAYLSGLMPCSHGHMHFHDRIGWRRWVLLFPPVFLCCCSLVNDNLFCCFRLVSLACKVAYDYTATHVYTLPHYPATALRLAWNYCCLPACLYTSYPWLLIFSIIFRLFAIMLVVALFYWRQVSFYLRSQPRGGQ